MKRLLLLFFMLCLFLGSKAQLDVNAKLVKTDSIRARVDTMNITNLAPYFVTVNDTLLQDYIAEKGGGGISFPLLAPDGSQSAPSYSFSSDTQAGLFYGFGQLQIVDNNSFIMSLDNTGIYPSVNYRNLTGSAGTPSYSFDGDTNSGLYRSTSDFVAMSTGGFSRMVWGNTRITTSVPFWVLGGSASVPSYSFNGDDDTGMYNIGSNSLGFSTNGAIKLEISNSNIFNHIDQLPSADDTYDLGSSTAAYSSTYSYVNYLSEETTTAPVVAGHGGLYVLDNSGVQELKFVDEVTEDLFIISQESFGQYQPNLTNTTNVSSSAAGNCSYSRIGDVITVTGRITLTPTASTTLTNIDLSVPVSTSNFTSADDGSGNFTMFDVSSVGVGYASALTTTDDIRFTLTSLSTNLHTIRFTFQYQIQ